MPENKPAYMSSDWFQGLQREVKASTQKVVAERMGIGRSTLTIVLNGLGTYGDGTAKTTRIELRYRQAFEQITCPFDGATVGAEHCRAKAHSSAPTHNPWQLNHWRTCQQCQFKPAAVAVVPVPKPRPRRADDLPIAAIDTKTLPLPEVGAPQIDLTTEETA